LGHDLDEVEPVQLQGDPPMNDSSVQVEAYLAYLAISLGLTIWVARTLFRNGRVFLVDVFRQNEALADSVNRLLVVGFYLVNLGMAGRTASDAIEAMAIKIGTVLFVLGGMHFANMYIFHRCRRGALLELAPPPVDPDGALPFPRA